MDMIERDIYTIAITLLVVPTVIILAVTVVAIAVIFAVGTTILAPIVVGISIFFITFNGIGILIGKISSLCSRGK